MDKLYKEITVFDARVLLDSAEDYGIPCQMSDDGQTWSDDLLIDTCGVTDYPFVGVNEDSQNCRVEIKTIQEVK